MKKESGGELEFEMESALGVVGESEEDLFELAAISGDGDARGFGSDRQERFSGGEAAEEGREVK